LAFSGALQSLNQGISLEGNLLLGGAVDEVDALCDVALETLDALLQESLLLLGDVLQGVGDLLDTVGLWGVSQLYNTMG
jgi:hypothetical protein